MDNNAYSQDAERGTELSLVPETSTSKKYHHGHSESCETDEKGKHRAQETATSTHSGGSGSGGGQEPGTSGTCKPDVCQRARERFAAPDLRGSPWHRRKTIFLITTIALLCSWAIIYSMLSKWDII